MNEVKKTLSGWNSVTSLQRKSTYKNVSAQSAVTFVPDVRGTSVFTFSVLFDVCVFVMFFYITYGLGMEETGGNIDETREAPCSGALI